MSHVAKNVVTVHVNRALIYFAQLTILVNVTFSINTLQKLGEIQNNVARSIEQLDHSKLIFRCIDECFAYSTIN